MTTNPSTVVCAFRSINDAQAAVQDLIQAGISREDISLVANNASGSYSSGSSYASGNVETDNVKRTTDGTSVGENVAAGAGFGALGGLLLGLGALAIPGIGPIIAAGPLAAALGGAAVGAAGGGVIGALKDAGVPDEDAQFYGDTVKQGGAIVTVHAQPGDEDRISAILDRHDAIDMDGRNSIGDVGTPAAGFTANRMADTLPASTPRATTGRQTTGLGDRDEQTLPVVQEELLVGKRSVERGGVRVYNRVTNEAVSEQVNLREEHVHVERRPVDRAATAADLELRDQTIEVREMAEEPVVSKRARVVEEIVIGKDATERTQQVSDTVRHTEVEVEQLGGGARAGAGAYDTDFRSDFQTRFGQTRGATFETYAPAYQYGSRMANDPQYRGKDWNTVEDTLKTDYLRNNPNSTWDQMKGAVRYGWEKVTGQR